VGTINPLILFAPDRAKPQKSTRNCRTWVVDRSMPILAIFGKQDRTILIASAMRLREINRSAKIVEIDGAGHALVSTHSDQVNTAILTFLE
jgi:pimeloyl-ACP methyl ester carboxylesterase